MNPLHCTVLSFVVLTGTLAYAREKPEYKSGRLVDVRSTPTGNGALRAQNSFCLAVQLDDVSYIARYEPFSRGSYEPTDLIVGDPIEVRVKDDNLYFRSGKNQAKAHITRRQRVLSGQPPATCSLPVAVDH